MANNLQLVKQYFDACAKKDGNALQSLVHPDYSLKDPIFQLSGQKDLIKMIEECPFECSLENMSFISEGDKVAATFENVSADSPFDRLRMCSVMTIENGKIKSEEMFYDSAKIPQEMKDSMKNFMPGKKKAA